MRVSIFASITNAFGLVIEKLVAVAAGLMLVVVSCNVFARYVLKIGLTWAEEFSLLLFVWVVFLGSYLALRSKNHLALTFLIKKLPPRAARVGRLVILSFVGLFLCALFVGGLQFVGKVIQMDQRTPLLGISAAWAYASLPVSAGLMLLELLQVLISGNHIIPEETETNVQVGVR